ncbi:hypothetical protein G9F72_005980 [Clostridium estertheticum]|uniref:hypothetical protein n=1 Tax=Clostridium estertheticum TaxID=238834 RepID=UPI0013E99B96|nr:hypothetical protein [Clostridium estertheticum]MBZ9685890.1 hypothetical protein [Clostridium estertheticum]
MDWTNILLNGIIFFLTFIACSTFYKKSGLTRWISKWINKKTWRTIFTLFIIFTFYLVTMKVIRSTSISGKYYNMADGFFLALYVSIVPYIFFEKYNN